MTCPSDPWIILTKPELADLLQALEAYYESLRAVKAERDTTMRRAVAAAVERAVAHDRLIRRYEEWVAAVERSGPGEGVGDA